jgi:predicted glutamine amidotransferase
MRANRWTGRAAGWLLIAIAATTSGGPGGAPHQCRFWSLIGSDYPDDLILDHLRDGSFWNLQELGAGNPDGWGFVSYPSVPEGTPLLSPLARRGGPPADDPYDPDFGRAAEELGRLRPRAALGHVRLASSNHKGVPDPHPFVRGPRSFAHNGTLNAAALRQLLADYLPTHPLEYDEGIGSVGPIDSELYFLFLLRYAEQHPELRFAEALRQGVQTLARNEDVTLGDPRLNFVLTDGDTLYACHFYGLGSTNAVQFYPDLVFSGGESPYWVAASQKFGSHNEGWGAVAARTLGVFVPGRAPEFLPIESPAGEGASMRRAPRSATLRPPAEDEPPPEHNCRFWGLIGTGYEADLIARHLRDGGYQNLKRLGGSNRDGWGLGCFPPASFPLALSDPIVRRGGPPANHAFAPEYDIAVDEMNELRPVAAVGHVRAATSGHSGIPNPHPFLHRGLLFAHNGGIVSMNALRERLGDYLITHPPDYKPGDTGTSYIDSELYFLYLLKLVDEQAPLSLGAALPEALRRLLADYDVIGPSPALNFVLTDGDTLYAFHCYGAGSSNPVRYYPGPAAAPARSAYWVVASEPLGDGSEGWATIPAQTLGVFVPGEAPQFHAIERPPRFGLANLSVTSLFDQDADGWDAALKVCCDPNVEQGTWSVLLELAATADGETWTDLTITRSFEITGNAPDTICVNGFAIPDTLPPTLWDLRLRLREATSGEVVFTATSAGFPMLGERRVEGAARDTVPDVPRGFHFSGVRVTGGEDQDDDGYQRAFTLRWDVDLYAAQDSARAYAIVTAVRGMNLIGLGTSPVFWIHGESPDSVDFPVTVKPAGRAPESWDLYLELYDADADTLADRAEPDDFPALGGVLVEGSREDEPETPPPPDTLGVSVAWAWPDFAPGEIRLHLHVHLAAATTVTLEVWDTDGRLVWQEGPTACGAQYEGDLIWRGETRDGGRAGSGVYLCRVRVGDASFRRRVVLIR